MKTMMLVTMSLALAACQKSPEAAGIDANATMIEADLQRQADNLEAMANQAADANAAEAIENVADHLEELKANIATAADAAKDKLPNR